LWCSYCGNSAELGVQSHHVYADFAQLPFEIERDSGGKNPGITDNAFDFQLEAAATYTIG